MKSSAFGAKLKGDLALELLYVLTAITLAIAISTNIPRAKSSDNRFPACYSNICFA